MYWSTKTSYHQALYGCLFEARFFFSLFFGHRLTSFLNDRKILSQFGHNVWKYRLVNAITASFNTIIGQMTEMSQRKKVGLKYIGHTLVLCKYVDWHASILVMLKAACDNGCSNVINLIMCHWFLLLLCKISPWKHSSYMIPLYHYICLQVNLPITCF